MPVHHVMEYYAKFKKECYARHQNETARVVGHC